jgi:imidazolonepropionase-like amidohydrolase
MESLSNDQPFRADLVIRNATLVRAPGAVPIPRATIVIRDGLISDGPAPAGAQELDAAGAVVTAGFWNCHVHLTEPVWSGAARKPTAQLQPALDDMFNSRGFTSVVDLGSNPLETAAVRRRIGAGELAGPRIRTAGTGIYPGGGLPFYTREAMPRLIRALTPTPRTRVGAAAASALNRWAGAEVVKLFTGSYIAPATVKPMAPAIAQAAVRIARRHGLPVFAHTSDRTGLQVALDAGVDVIAHVPDTTEGTAPLLREAAALGRWLVPTLDMFAQTVTRDRAYIDPIHASLNLFREGGGRLLFGTDVGYLPDHDPRGELAALDACGLGVDDVLAMLTTHPAAAFGTGTGTAAPGQPGDLVLLDKLATVTDLATVRTTVRAGQVTWTRATTSPAEKGRTE